MNSFAHEKRLFLQNGSFLLIEPIPCAFSNYLKASKFYNLNIKYLQIEEDLIKFKGFITGLGLKDEIPEEEVNRLIEYSFLLTQIFAYELRYSAHKIIKSPKPPQEPFRESYNTIKQDLDQIKRIGVEEHKTRFDLFLKEFEKNEK